MIAVDSILCRKCFDIVNVHHTLCRCHNVGYLIDMDNHPRVYVDNILTTQRAIQYLDDDLKEITRELGATFNTAIFADYSLATTPLNFTAIPPKKHSPKSPYNKRLMKAFDLYKHKTSDGNERHRRTAT